MTEHYLTTILVCPFIPYSGNVKLFGRLEPDSEGYFISGFPELPIANRLTRLEVLQGLYNYYKEHENVEKCQELLDLAERETAPVYKYLNDFLSDAKGLRIDSWEA